MKYEFKKNGEVSLTIKPDGNIEQEFFKELFNGEVNIDKVSSANHNGEIVFTIKRNSAKDKNSLVLMDDGYEKWVNAGKPSI